MSSPTRKATPVKPMSRPSTRRASSRSSPIGGHDDRRDQRHHGQQQTGVELFSCVSACPSSNHGPLISTPCRPAAPSSGGTPEQRPPVQRDRQQQRGPDHGAAECDDHRIDVRVDGDLDQQVRHAPDQAHGREQHPASPRHRSLSSIDRSDHGQRRIGTVVPRTAAVAFALHNRTSDSHRASFRAGRRAIGKSFPCTATSARATDEWRGAHIPDEATAMAFVRALSGCWSADHDKRAAVRLRRTIWARLSVSSGKCVACEQTVFAGALVTSVTGELR